VRTNPEDRHERGWRDWRSWWTRRAQLTTAAVLAAVVLAGAIAISGGPWGNDPEVDASAISDVKATTTTTKPKATTTTAKPKPTTTTAKPTTTTAPPATSASVPPPDLSQAQPTTPPAASQDVSDTGALCVGDSIMLGASSQYYGTLTMCGTVDAKVGRQMSEGVSVVASHAPYPSTVIVHLGTNGSVAGLDTILNYLGGVPRVVLVTVQLNGTRSWEGPDNSAIRAAAASRGNVILADWYAASSGHPEYFISDRIHLTSTGAQAYAATIAAAL